MKDAYKDALMRRKGRGVDLSIIIAPQKEMPSDDKTDLAPEMKMEDEESRLPVHDGESMKMGMDEMDDDVSSSMSESEIESLRAPGRRLSLGERARLEAMKRKGKA